MNSEISNPIPRVSVVVDTYNHAAFIERAIESVLEQDFPATEMEILVVDDGSTDATPEIIARFGSRVRSLRKENGGQASAYNFAFPHTRGAVVAFLDGDDWWAPQKLSVVMGVFEQHPEVGLVGHGFFSVEQERPPYPAVTPERDSAFTLRNRDGAALFGHLRGFIGGSRLTVRRSVLEKILPVPQDLVIEADEYIFTLAAAHAEAHVLAQPLFYYRLHEENLYQMRQYDDGKVRRKLRVTQSLAEHLPVALEQAGVPGDAAATALEPLRLEAQRMRLTLEGGSPWETFSTERAMARLGHGKFGVGYAAFKAGVLALSLVLPPRKFYRWKQRYAQSRAREWRRALGEPASAAPVVTRIGN